MSLNLAAAIFLSRGIMRGEVSPEQADPGRMSQAEGNMICSAMQWVSRRPLGVNAIRS